MTSKKPAAAKTAAKAKTVSTPAVANSTASNPMSASTAFKRVWALPAAMLMLVVAAMGLWFAVRESSNAPQAATPAATAAVMAPDAPKSKAPAAPTGATTDPAKPADTTTAAAMKPVSVTGCLQRDGEGFVLKDTEGTDAPKSRSWKSGFLRKHTASIDLLDPSNAAHLSTQVGKRVTVTGPLADREMRVQSVRRVAASCQ